MSTDRYFLIPLILWIWQNAALRVLLICDSKLRFSSNKVPKFLAAETGVIAESSADNVSIQTLFSCCLVLMIRNYVLLSFNFNLSVNSLYA